MLTGRYALSWDEFERTAIPFGWKDEYIDSIAQVTPYAHGVLTRLAITPRPINDLMSIIPLGAHTAATLAPLFYRAFSATAEYFGYQHAEIQNCAMQELERFFNARRGEPQPALCHLACLPGQSEQIVGACLVARYRYGYKNALLFVDPDYQRQGIGSALLNAVVNKLHILGEPWLWSEYAIANAISARWHQQQGFVDIPDLHTAKIRHNHYRRELRRQILLGNEEAISALRPGLAVAEQQVAELQQLEAIDFDAAWLTWRWDS